VASSQANLQLFQIFQIPHSHACVVVTIRNIPPGEQITVKYEKEGYYLQNACLCKSCTNRDPSDLSVLKPKGKGEGQKEEKIGEGSNSGF
jgi:hypothetical protein